MNEQEIFNEALEIVDVQSRSAFLDQACGADQQLRIQVDALLEEYEKSGEFLGIPVVEQMRRVSDATRVAPDDDSALESDLDLSFLEPAKVSGSLGSLGHYDIQELIGRGGCGIVFKAFDQRLHRIVAIKVMTPAMAATSPARKRFLREARATAAIRHENVVNIYAVEEAPLPFLVMEYIDSKTLQEVLDETGPLDLQTILRFGQMIANGLEAAHLKGLIHRDIKPANILIESGTGQVKLTDFGLARAADDASQSQSGIIAGTPLYMSPEQVQGYKLDQRSDLFSLGSVLYVMCTGRAPFRARSTLAVLKRVVDEQPRNIQEVISEVPDWLIAIINKLHEKDPANRFVSAQEVSDRLSGNSEVAALNNQFVEDSAPSVSTRVSRGPFPWMKIAAILILLLSSFGFTEATGITNVRGTVIHLFSPEGTLVIEVDDPGVSVSIDGQELVITGAGVKEIRMKPGQYQLQATKNGEVLKQELITLTRNGRQVVQVSQEPALAAAVPEVSKPELKTVDPDRRAAEYVLSIGGKVRVNDDSIKGESKLIVSNKDLPHDPFQLTHVFVNSNDKIDDSGLASFQGTKHLRNLEFTYCPHVSDAGFVYFRENHKLQMFHIWQLNVSGDCLKDLIDFSDLRDVRFGIIHAPAEKLSILQQFKSFQKLKTLMLSGTDANDSTLAMLSGARHVQQLNLEHTDVTDAGLVFLEQYQNLRFVYLNGAKVTAAGVKRLSEALPECKIEWLKPDDPDRRAAEYVLSVGGKVWVNKDSAFTDDNVIQTREKLPSEPFRLTHADLKTNPRVTDAGLEAFRGTKHLRGIYLTNSSNVGDAGVAQLKENNHLHEIHLWGTKVSGTGLKAFENCSEIIDFYIGYTRVTDADMPFFRNFAGWKTLRCIMISGLDISDEGIANLAGAPGLGQIHLERTKITDTGLLQLAKCPKLGLIWAYDTKLTRQGIERFIQARDGKCRVLWEEPETTKAPTASMSSTDLRWLPDAGQRAFFEEVARLDATDQVAAVSNKLMEINPGFDGKLKKKIEEGRVVGLSILAADHIAEIWPVRALPELTSLVCDATHLTHGKLTDISPLAGLPLTRVGVSNSSVSDLTPLKGMKLVHLYGTHTKIKDLSPLSEMPLKVLLLWSSPYVSDLSPLKGLRLTNLNLDFTQVADLSPLRGMELTNLAVHQTQISSLLPLSGMPLQELYCSNTRISDLSPLKGAPLNILHIENTQVSDLSPLAGMPLKKLCMEKTLVSDLSPLGHMPLEQLTLSLPLFQEQDEKLLNQLSLKHLGMNVNEVREAEVFWREWAAQKKAVEAFATAYAQEPASVRTKAILGKLREDANGVGLVPIVEEGVVTEVTLTLAPESQNISSLRMLNSLRRLTLKGGTPTLDLSPINSLPVESLVCSELQALRNRLILAEMTSLTTINGHAKLEYLQSIQPGSKTLPDK
tara:strand:- start:3211 stop:7506 length:4296 start_codon:yes stop_codon:yes gene_type:complete